MILNIYSANLTPNKTSIPNPDIPNSTLPINETECPDNIEGIQIGNTVLTKSDGGNSKNIKPYTFFHDKSTGKVKFALPDDDFLNNAIKNKLPIDAYINDKNNSDFVNKDSVRDITNMPLKGEVQLERSLENHPQGSIKAIINVNQKTSFKSIFKPGKFITLANIPFRIESYNIRLLPNKENPIRTYEATVKLIGKWTKFIDNYVRLTNKPTSTYSIEPNNNVKIDSECILDVSNIEEELEHKESFKNVNLTPLIAADAKVNVIGIPVYYKINSKEEIDTYLTDWYNVTKEQARVNSSFITLSEPEGIIVKPLSKTVHKVVHEMDIINDEGTSNYDNDNNYTNTNDTDITTDLPDTINPSDLENLADESITNENNINNVPCPEFDNKDGLYDPDDLDDSDNPDSSDNPDNENYIPPDPDEVEPEEPNDNEEEDENETLSDEKPPIIEITGNFDRNPGLTIKNKPVNKIKYLPFPQWRKAPPKIITTREGDVNASQPPVGTATEECETWDLSLNFDQGGQTKTIRESTTYNGSPYRERSWTYGFMYLAADMAGIDKDGYPTAKKGYAPFWGLIRQERTIHNYDNATGYYLGYTTTSKQTRRFKQEDTQNPESISMAMELLTINKQLEEGVFYNGDGTTRPLTTDDIELFNRDIRYMEKVKESITFKEFASRTVNKLQIVDYGQFYDDAVVNNLIPYKVCLPNGESKTLYMVDPSVIVPAFVIAELTETSAFASMENPENILRKYEWDKDMEAAHPQPAYSDSDKQFIPLPKLTTGEDTSYFRELKIYAKGKKLKTDDFFDSTVLGLDRYVEYTSDYSGQDGGFIASATRKSFKEYVGRPGEATRRDLGWERVDPINVDDIQQNQEANNSSQYISKKNGQKNLGNTTCFNFNGIVTSKQLEDGRLFLTTNTTVNTKLPNIVSMGSEYAYTPNQAISAVLSNLYLEKLQSKSISTIRINLDLSIKELDTITVIRKSSTVTGRVLSVRHSLEIGSYTMGDYINPGSYSSSNDINKALAAGLKVPLDIPRNPRPPQSFLKAYTEITLGVPKCTAYNVILAPKEEVSRSSSLLSRKTSNNDSLENNLFNEYTKESLELGATLVNIPSRRFGI